MNTLQLTYVFALLGVLTMMTVGIGALIGLIARSEAHPQRVRVTDDRRPETAPILTFR
ncbi:hypothetical protein [Gordonia sp. OPL2]|uniref:hypothetical protein n=1 Tax=Gordonia sp. OPL2 TaxID=2486274 RepID=UPI001655F57A|nr:hypothetical protein [Gordonia sp. OPL2]